MRRSLSIFRPIVLLGAGIYFIFFAFAGSGVISKGSLVWHADTLLPFEVMMWTVFAVMLVRYGLEAANKL